MLILKFKIGLFKFLIELNKFYFMRLVIFIVKKFQKIKYYLRKRFYQWVDNFFEIDIVVLLVNRLCLCKVGFMINYN